MNELDCDLNIRKIDSDFSLNPSFIYYGDGYINKYINQIMTYIICGKIDNNPFLMVDCAGIPTNGEDYIYHDKLVRLTATKKETYVTLTGQNAFQKAIEIFDNKCYLKHITFDFENIEQINEILDIYRILISRNEFSNGIDLWEKFIYVKIFFINESDVFFYIIKKDVETNGFNIIDNKIRQLKNDTIMDVCGHETTDFHKLQDDELIEYCKKTIINEHKLLRGRDGLDLKDRFSYITFNNSVRKYINPSKNDEELVLSFICGKYEELD